MASNAANTPMAKPSTGKFFRLCRLRVSHQFCTCFFLNIYRKLFDLKAPAYGPRNVFGRMMFITTFVSENVIHQETIFKKHLKLHSVGFGFLFQGVNHFSEKFYWIYPKMLDKNNELYVILKIADNTTRI
jgi:hypothetical protein